MRTKLVVTGVLPSESTEAVVTSSVLLTSSPVNKTSIQVLLLGRGGGGAQGAGRGGGRGQWAVTKTVAKLEREAGAPTPPKNNNMTIAIKPR